MSFPLVTFRDMVNVQKALLESLGVTRLKAVIGASGGALQAYEWAASYPQMVERIIPVIAHSEPDSFLIAWLGLWAQPILLDPKWKGGDYDPNDPPTEGLKAALKLVTLQAFHWQSVNANQAVVSAKEAADPAKAFENKFKVEAWLDAAAAGRAAVSDANHFLYIIKANQLASADASKIKVPTLLLYAPTDLVFPAPLVEETARKIASTGVPVETMQLPGPAGHLNGLLAIAQAGEKIRAFIEK
jgi:homoserine O-acetyltransferase